ncbi:hypothetical protein THRCLA_05544 [Thraustotheca clavata]|uniref:Pentacotripeptide-repeat region of PRORP domain-containing protein n=1 Tax=Thraustotheca clavata TaxID=74557 RepID=A0A1V9ZVK2_9STRA|nr:hypothetical protein THRCLA_05544 [Thraustotheca clavata]
MMLHVLGRGLPSLKHRSFSTVFIDAYNDVRQHAEKHHTIKATRLTRLFQVASNKSDILDGVQILKLCETRNIQPAQETAGEFIKKCIECDAGDVALKLFQSHSRLGLYVNTGSLNKLLIYFFDKKEYANVITLYHEMQAYQVKFNKETYNVCIRSLLEQNEINTAVQLLQYAAANKAIKRYTCNYVLAELVKRGLHDKIQLVSSCMKKYGIDANDTTKHLAANDD